MSTRPMTEAEIASMAKGICPCCKNKNSFTLGGTGMFRSMTCSCGLELSVSEPDLVPFFIGNVVKWPANRPEEQRLSFWSLFKKWLS